MTIAFRVQYLLAPALLLLLTMEMAACGDKEPEKQPDTQELLQQVQNVVGVGKVVPADGWTIVSSPVAGRISALHVKEGDSVKKGQTILELDAEEESLSIRQQRERIHALKADEAAARQDLEREEFRLKELEQVYRTSLELFEKKAETREKVQQDESAWKQQELKVMAARTKLQSNQSARKEQQLEIERAQTRYNRLKITAAADGILQEFDPETGGTVTAGTELGRIVNPGNLLIEAEVDELFAEKIKPGQTVSFHHLGRKDLLGEGVIINVSPALSNKSIMYESVGEASDRRVRRFVIKPGGNTDLLINAKVECQISIQ